MHDRARNIIPKSIESRLIEAASKKNAAAIGTRALLWVLSEVKKNDWQQVEGGWVIEMCPSYLRTIDGVTHWAARQCWPMVSDIIGWDELSFKQARSLGFQNKIKKVKRRFGRFVFVNSKLKTEIHSAAASLGLSFAGHDDHEVEYVIHPKRVPRAGRGSVAVRCPCTANHRNGDRNPSVILWRNSGGNTGGARCMVCQRDDLPMTWFVKFRDDGSLELIRPRRAMGLGLARSKGTSKVRCRKVRNNYNPSQCKLTAADMRDVGSHISTKRSNGRYVTAKIEGFDTPRGYRTARRVVSACRNGLMDSLRWHERSSAGPSQTSKAEIIRAMDVGREKHEQFLPSCLISNSTMRPSDWVNNRPINWAPARQKWILYDLDHLNLSQLDVDQLFSKLKTTFEGDRTFSGTFAVVRTGPSGLHVWVEMKYERYHPKTWHRLPGVVKWYASFGNRILKLVRACGGRKGVLDMSSCAAGRFGRRPGWRILRDGQVYRSHLLMAHDGIKYEPIALLDSTIRLSHRMAVQSHSQTSPIPQYSQILKLLSCLSSLNRATNSKAVQDCPKAQPMTFALGQSAKGRWTSHPDAANQSSAGPDARGAGRSSNASQRTFWLPP